MDLSKLICVITLLLINPIVGFYSNLECTDELTNQVIGEKCFTFIQSISSWSSSYRETTASDSTYWCHRKIKVAMQSEIQALQKMVDERIKNTGTSHLTTLEQMIASLVRARDEYTNFNSTTSTNIGEIAYSIRLGDFEAAKTIYQRLGTSSLKPLINSFYEKEIKNAAILADFISTLSNKDEIYLGYRLLIDKLKVNIQLYSSVTTTIGYRIRYDISQNLNLALLRSSIPESIKLFPFNTTFKIINFKYNEAIFANSEGFYFDTLRRMSFTSNAPTCTTFHCEWSIHSDRNGTNFYLKNIQQNEYLYADANDLALDTRRHSVFTWRKVESPGEIGQWKIEPIEDTNLFKIKNTFWNEYLYSEENKYEKSLGYRYVFTLKSDRCDHDGCKWAFKSL